MRPQADTVTEFQLQLQFQSNHLLRHHKKALLKNLGDSRSWKRSWKGEGSSVVVSCSCKVRFCKIRKDLPKLCRCLSRSSSSSSRQTEQMQIQLQFQLQLQFQSNHLMRPQADTITVPAPAPVPVKSFNEASSRHSYSSSSSSSSSQIT